jgi:hypothetical protein
MSIEGDLNGVSIFPASTIRRAYDRFVMNASNWRVCGLKTVMPNLALTQLEDPSSHSEVRVI